MGILDRKKPLLRPLLQLALRYRPCHKMLRLAERIGIRNSSAAVSRHVVVEEGVLRCLVCISQQKKVWREY